MEEAGIRPVGRVVVEAARSRVAVVVVAAATAAEAALAGVRAVPAALEEAVVAEYGNNPRG